MNASKDGVVHGVGYNLTFWSFKAFQDVFKITFFDAINMNLRHLESSSSNSQRRRGLDGEQCGLSLQFAVGVGQE